MTAEKMEERMCVVSMITDGWNDQFHKRWSEKYYIPNGGVLGGITRGEFLALKEEVEELKKLLLAAKEFDKKTGQPNCESGQKAALLRSIADALGVDINEIFE